MKDDLGNIVAVVGLWLSNPPSSDEEQELLTALVEKWMQKHGEKWVRSNFLLELEWVRIREKIRREKGVWPIPGK